MQNKPLLLVVAPLAIILAGCGKSETREIKSGRLSYVETSRYGSVGTHGSQGWYVSDQHFYVDGSRYSPKGIDVHRDLARAEASPNPSVEAIRSYSFADSKETAYVLRMKGGQPEWVTASDIPYDGGDNLGQWTGDGHWLLFKDYFFNVETSERSEIRGLPDAPRKYFIAAAPDLETIIYREDCYSRRYDPETHEPVPDPAAEARCRMYDEHIKNGIEGFWLIDSRTGQMKMLALKKEDYPWVGSRSSSTPNQWLSELRGKLQWEKDEGTGRYTLVYPK